MDTNSTLRPNTHDYSPRTPPRIRHPRPSTGVPQTPPSPVVTPGLSQSWSIGTIPICFEPYAPSLKISGASPSFPSGGDSPHTNYSPQTFGYPDDEGLPATTLRRRWKERVDMHPTLERQSSLLQPPDFVGTESDDNASVFSLSAYMHSEDDEDVDDLEELPKPQAKENAKQLLPALEPSSNRESTDSSYSRDSRPPVSSAMVADGTSSSASSALLTQSSCTSSATSILSDPDKALPDLPIPSPSPTPSYSLSTTPSIESYLVEPAPPSGSMTDARPKSGSTVDTTTFGRQAGHKVSQSVASKTTAITDESSDSEGEQLPRRIAWLRDRVLELHLDQENFRSCVVKMHFRSHSYLSTVAPFVEAGIETAAEEPQLKPPRALDELDFGCLGVAEFKPLAREAYPFHYAPFEFTPTLRRVTVNQDESRDYISRSAKLNLKETGVYTVHKVEEKGRIVWKFEYFVDEKLSPVDGRPVPGERLIIPLSFKCSPLLLDPEKGQKVRLLQVVRKGIQFRISSAKLTPPQLPTSPAVSPIPSLKESSSRSTIASGSSSSASGTRSRLKASTFSRVLSRPTTPKRSSAGTKRPNTAKEDDERPLLGTPTDPSMTVRHRASSVSSNSQRPSTASRLDWSKLQPIAGTFASPGVSPLPSPRHSDLPQPSRPRPSLQLSPLLPHIPGPIVPSQQIKEWLDQSSPPKPPSGLSRRPLLPKRPNTATAVTGGGVPWERI